MKKKPSIKNGIAISVVAILAIVLFMVRIKSDFGGLLPKSEEVDDNASTIINAGDTSVDLSLVEVNEDFFNSMNEKELIHYKVINSIDFFDTVEGEFQNFGFYFDDTVKYIIDIKNNRSFEHEESSEKNIDSIFNDYKCIELDNTDNTYKNIQVLNKAGEEPSYLRKFKPKQRYDGNGILSNRSTILISGTGRSVLAEETLGGHLRDHERWSIDGSEEFIGRKCTKISGEREVVDTKTKVSKFTALIDTETGVVLKYDEMDASGEAVNGFETKYIKYNETYDDKIFEIPKEGYTENVY